MREIRWHHSSFFPPSKSLVLSWWQNRELMTESCFLAEPQLCWWGLRSLHLQYVLHAFPGRTQDVLCQYIVTWLLQRSAHFVIMSQSSCVRQCVCQINTDDFIILSRETAVNQKCAQYMAAYLISVSMKVCLSFHPHSSSWKHRIKSIAWSFWITVNYSICCRQQIKHPQIWFLSYIKRVFFSSCIKASSKLFLFNRVSQIIYFI